MKIALLGYGKMGKEIEQIALQRNHTVDLIIDANNANDYSLTDLKKVDAAIEFSTPESSVSNIYKCFEAGIPIVVGTTGWLDKLDEVKKICSQKSQTLFYASNYSVGVNLFFKFNEYIAKMMNNYPEYNVSIEETHHVHKLDAPSGTAISIANQIIENNSLKKRWVNDYSDKPEELQIISSRLEEVPGTHVVSYSSSVDEIEIIHTAHNRKGFAKGAVLAAEWIQGKKGVFSMADMLHIPS
jgi:4-hydroxy-tetrahydrodipicolinate reductase